MESYKKYKQVILSGCEYNIQDYLKNENYYDITAEFGCNNVMEINKTKKNNIILSLIFLVLDTILIILLATYTTMLLKKSDNNYQDTYLLWWGVGGAGVIITCVAYFSTLLYQSKILNQYFNTFKILMQQDMIDNDVTKYPKLIQMQFAKANATFDNWKNTQQKEYKMYMLFWVLYGYGVFFDKLNQYYLNQEFPS